MSTLDPWVPERGLFVPDKDRLKHLMLREGVDPNLAQAFSDAMESKLIDDQFHKREYIEELRDWANTHTHEFVDNLYPGIDDIWTQMSDMPRRLASHSVAYLNGKLYVTNGSDPASTGTNDILDVYDIASDSWTASVSTIPNPSGGGAEGIGVGDFVYFIGGINNIHERYDPSSNSWVSLTACPVDIRWSTLAHISGDIWVFGSLNDLNASRAYVYTYNISSNSWTQQLDLPEQLGASVGGLLPNDELIVAGGRNSVNDPSDLAFKRTSTWGSISNLGFAREFLEGAVAGGRLYAMGGIDPSGVIIDNNEEFNPSVPEWTNKTVMPAPVRNGASVTDGTYIYVLGGDPPGTQQAIRAVWRYG